MKTMQNHIKFLVHLFSCIRMHQNKSKVAENSVFSGAFARSTFTGALPLDPTRGPKAAPWTPCRFGKDLTQDPPPWCRILDTDLNHYDQKHTVFFFFFFFFSVFFSPPNFARFGTPKRCTLPGPEKQPQLRIFFFFFFFYEDDIQLQMHVAPGRFLYY